MDREEVDKLIETTRNETLQKIFFVCFSNLTEKYKKEDYVLRDFRELFGYDEKKTSELYEWFKEERLIRLRDEKTKLF